MSEEEAKTERESGEVGTTLTEMSEGPEGSGAETRPGSAAAGRGATLDATAAEADAAEAGGSHGME